MRDYKVSWKTSKEQKCAFVSAKNQGEAIIQVLNHLSIVNGGEEKMLPCTIKVERWHV